MAGNVPTGFDWADGQSGRAGTPNPAGSVIDSVDSSFEELVDSPSIERGEKLTIKHDFRTEWANGLDLIKAIYRGTQFIDSSGLITRVVNSTLQKTKGDQSTLSFSAEGMFVDTPPDEFRIETVEINPALEKHPRYKNLYKYNIDVDTGLAIDDTLYTGPQMIELMRSSASDPQSVSRNSNFGLLNPDNVGMTVAADEAISEAKDLFQKFSKGIQDFYLSGIRVVWTSHYWLPQLLHPGGIIEDPVDQGGLPFYFWSDNAEADGQNILTTLPPSVNPLIYGDGIEFFRFSDEQHFNLSLFHVTRSWMGAPLGHWDRDLYPLADDVIPP